MIINWFPLKKLRSYLRNPYFSLLAAIGMIFSGGHELFNVYETLESEQTYFSVIHGAVLFGIFHAGIAISDIWESIELFEKAETSSQENN